jgi:hypothetical protein
LSERTNEKKMGLSEGRDFMGLMLHGDFYGIE